MRTFGIEMEFVGDMRSVLREIRNAGFSDAIDATHTHNTGVAPDAWCVKRDGSVYDGGEVTSPILDFDNEENREQVNRVVKAMQRAGASTDPRAGIHVHIGARNHDGSLFTGKQIAATVRFVYKFEDAIYRIASSGWRSLRPGASTYAQPIPDATAKAIMAARTEQQVQNVWDGNSRQSRYGFYSPSLDRYTALNLRSFWLRQTIEFRHFNSSLNPNRIQAYIALCQAIMEDARQGHSRQVATHYPLGSMKAGLVTEEALFLRLQQVLTTTGRDTDRLMSKEDWKLIRKLGWNGSRPQEDIFGNNVHTRWADRGGVRSA
jgi:hypothetical protein